MVQQYQRILVAGGAGFIGSHIVDALLETGVEVTVFDNLSTGRISNLKDWARDKNFRFIRGDVRDAAQVKAAVKNVDAVFNDAAVVSVRLSIDNPMRVHETNVSGALNLLKASVDSSVKRFIQASSASVYGNVTAMPITEDMPLNPISPYAVSELAAEKYAHAFYRVYGLESMCLRYFNVYGPRQQYNSYSGVITIFLNQLLSGQPITIFGDGEQTRDFVYVKDVAYANMLALKKERAEGQVFNVATGIATPMNELAKELMKITNKKTTKILHTNPIAGEIKHSCASIRKANEVLGYKPDFTISHGLTQLVDWCTSEQVSP